MIRPSTGIQRVTGIPRSTRCGEENAVPASALRMLRVSHDSRLWGTEGSDYANDEC